MSLQGFGIDLVKATVVTLQLALTALIYGLLMAGVLALAKLSRIRWLAVAASVVTDVIRGLPELLVIFIIYFGGTFLLSKISGGYVEVNAFIAGVIALGSIFAAYASETLRGAFLALDRGQAQAALALGFSPWLRFYKIILPQMWRHALPGLANLWLVLLKDTSLVSLVGLTELMGQAKLAAAFTHQPFNFYFAAAIIYLALTTVSLEIIAYLQKIVSRGVRTC